MIWRQSCTRKISKSCQNKTKLSPSGKLLKLKPLNTQSVKNLLCNSNNQKKGLNWSSWKLNQSYTLFKTKTGRQQTCNWSVKLTFWDKNCQTSKKNYQTWKKVLKWLCRDLPWLTKGKTSIMPIYLKTSLENSVASGDYWMSMRSVRGSASVNGIVFSLKIFNFRSNNKRIQSRCSDRKNNFNLWLQLQKDSW